MSDVPYVPRNRRAFLDNEGSLALQFSLVVLSKASIVDCTDLLFNWNTWGSVAG